MADLKDNIISRVTRAISDLGLDSRGDFYGRVHLSPHKAKEIALCAVLAIENGEPGISKVVCTPHGTDPDFGPSYMVRAEGPKRGREPSRIIYETLFSGTDAKERAEEYAYLKYAHRMVVVGAT